MPGNIWVDSTVTEKTPRPRKRYRLTANAAKIATATEKTAATRRHDQAVDQVAAERDGRPHVDERLQRQVGWATR